MIDLFIIGGGPAGLATAIAARRKGFRVTVADVTVPPADKACGEGLMPDGLAALAGLGVRIPRAEGFPFAGIRFLEGATSVTGSFPASAALGVRRTTLHRILLEHAEAAGVDFRWGSAVDLDSIRARWIIGADGENSLVRKWAGLDRFVRDWRRFGFRRHYGIEPWTDRMELHWADRCQVYVTPVSADSVCVAALSRDSQVRLDDALRNFPTLARRLRSDAILTAERGAVSSSRKLEAVARGRVALVGDASGSVDAITGEGLCLAFRQAVALADSLESGDLALYQQRHRSIARSADWMGRLLLMLADHGRSRRAAFSFLAANPKIFSKVLAVHVGALDEIDTSDICSGSNQLVWAGDGARSRSGTNAC